MADSLFIKNEMWIANVSLMPVLLSAHEQR